MGTEFVFSVMDFVVGGLLMIVTFIWFRSKHVDRFYEACKVRVKTNLESLNCFSFLCSAWRLGVC